MIDYFKVFNESEIKFSYRSDNLSSWIETYEKLPFRSISYLSCMLDYQLAYHSGQGGNWIDISCLLYHNNKPIGIWPLTISELDNRVILSSQGLPVMPPIFIAECSEKIKKKYSRECFRLIKLISDEIRQNDLKSLIPYIHSPDIGDWHLSAMKNGASCHVYHKLFVDLRTSIEEIKSKIRRRYRSFIHLGEQLWRVEIVQSPGNINAWNEFKDLHLKVSGRITRSQLSWDLQYQALTTNEAFLILLRDNSEAIVGGGYFMYSSDEGLYAVGAYDRSLFDKPLGHVIQFHAIQELKRLGCSWYQIGTRNYPGDYNSPSPKEMTISMFKEGFASHTFPSYLLNI